MGFRHSRFSRGKPWIKLPRHRRADAVFALKKRIAKGEYENFYTHDLFDEGLSWVDVVFQGRDKFTLWNAMLVTTANALYDKKHEMAFDQTYDALTPEEKALRPKIEFKAIPGRPGYKEMVFGVEPKFEKFDGRDVNEQIRHLEETLVVEVRENIRFDHSYRYGIGLHAIIDVPLITPPVVTQFIRSFLAMGEREWTSDREPLFVDGPVYLSNAIR